MNKKEFYLQASICDYLNRFYPNILYRSDLAGLKMTIGQAMQIKMIQKYKSWPDLFIYEMAYSQEMIRSTNFQKYVSGEGIYKGLAIEIKLRSEDIFKKNGSFRNEHVSNQSDMLKKLQRRGYKAVFGIGFEHIQKEIDDYLKYRIDIDEEPKLNL